MTQKVKFPAYKLTAITSIHADAEKGRGGQNCGIFCLVLSISFFSTLVIITMATVGKPLKCMLPWRQSTKRWRVPPPTHLSTCVAMLHQIHYDHISKLNARLLVGREKSRFRPIVCRWVYFPSPSILSVFFQLPLSADVSSWKSANCQLHKFVFLIKSDRWLNSSFDKRWKPFLFQSNCNLKDGFKPKKWNKEVLKMSPRSCINIKFNVISIIQ